MENKLNTKSFQISGKTPIYFIIVLSTINVKKVNKRAHRFHPFLFQNSKYIWISTRGLIGLLLQEDFNI